TCFRYRRKLKFGTVIVEAKLGIEFEFGVRSSIWDQDLEYMCPYDLLGPNLTWPTSCASHQSGFACLYLQPRLGQPHHCQALPTWLHSAALAMRLMAEKSL